MADQTICIDSDGSLSFIYSDSMVELLDEGEATIRRVSHVEPATSNSKQWTADMGPGEGPGLGPFTTRQEALDTEVQWLKKNRGL